MNKQPKTIDANKFLDRLEEIDAKHLSSGLGMAMFTYADLVGLIEREKFEIDPIPLPTIKPEDWVYHTKFKAKGQVKRISESGKRAYVIWINGAAPSFVDLKSLEVVSHD